MSKGNGPPSGGSDRAAPDKAARPRRDSECRAPWGLAPSDFAFLWDECRACFYRKVVLGRPRPRAPFPGVFTRIDRAMKDRYVGCRSDVLVESMPGGVIVDTDRWVRSGAIVAPGCTTACVIRGRVDALVDFDDNTTGIIDFNTVAPNDDHVGSYTRQLHAYATAVEYPAVDAPRRVSTLGLLCFIPQHFEAALGAGALTGETRWLEVPRDDDAFNTVLAEAASVLEHPDPPTPSPNCGWCARDADARAVA